jgi:plasmid stabilization system protein ParE
MNYKALLMPRAFKERNEIIIWYAERSHDATKNFIKEFGETIDKICSVPYQYRNVHKNFREILMKKYPYYLVYLIDEENAHVRILTVYHTSRNPKNKYRDL